MSETNHSAEPSTPMVIPVRPTSPLSHTATAPTPTSTPPSTGGGIWRVLLVLFLFGSLSLNLMLCIISATALEGAGTAGSFDTMGMAIHERTYTGNSSASDKVAIVRVDGVIMEGMLSYAHKQIEKVCKDASVKAVVLRIESPGGTITASDDLHRRFIELRDGTNPRVKNPNPKKLVVSMGNLAASGGYYIAMPAEKLFAERTTITGSIGVYASFINAAEMAAKYGVRMDLVKAGGIKGAGSMLQEITPQERQQWQDMVDNAYEQFLGVVEAGRPELKGRLREKLFSRPIKVYDAKGNVKPHQGEEPIYSRERADGGIFTAQEALRYGLIDEIGYVEDAAAAAAVSAGLLNYKVVVYDKPNPLFGSLLGVQANAAAPSMDLNQLAQGMTPRLWYLMPGAEVAGFLSAAAEAKVTSR